MPAIHPRPLMAFRGLLALALMGALASLVTPFAANPTRAAEHAVQIADSAFSPSTLTIAAGDTVTWRNADDRPHTVTSIDGAFDSGNLDEGVGFSFTFTAPGTYTYRCDYHPDMQATIVVEASSAPAPGAPSPVAGGTASGGTDTTASGAGSAPQGTHAPGTHDTSQPDTALDAPISLAWLAPLLIGLGLVAFAFGLIPAAGKATQVQTELKSGWRR